VKAGVRSDPYRYRLPNEDDQYYDRGELPPLRPFEPIFGVPVVCKKKRGE
jgi:hypothetical protein